MDQYVLNKRISPAEVVQLSNFKATALPLRLTKARSAMSDTRDGHLNWSLYGNAGSIALQTAGAFAERDTSYYGTEQSSGSGHPAVSRCEFSEGVQHFSAKGKITFPDGTIQNVAGSVAVMESGMQVWSGRIFNQDKPATAQYYIAQTIRRQRIGTDKFHLLIFPIQRLFDGKDVGTHILKVYNDSTGIVLSEQPLVLTPDPQSNLNAILDISDAVNQGDVLRIEVIAQLSLSNPNSPTVPVAGGSYSGSGFLDNTP